MRRSNHALLLLAGALVLGLTPVPASSQEKASRTKRPRTESVPPPAPSAGPAIQGTYSVEGSAAEIRVGVIGGDYYALASSDGWDSVGMLDGAVYHGVFRHLEGAEAPGGALGELTVDWTDPEHPTLRGRYTVRRSGEFTQRWRRMTDARKPPPPTIVDKGDTPGRPEVGEYVHVEELPEAITKVPPVYPEEAKRAGVEGTVVVQVLVLEDGTVGETRIVGSVPGLDDAAVASARQWRFKPALSAGNPVAVWVAVPIRFTKQ